MSNKINYFKLIAELWERIRKKRKKQLFLAFIVMLISALADLLSIATAIPFIYIISSDSKEFFEYEVIKTFSNFFNVYDQGKIVFFVSLIFAVFIIIAGLTKLLNILINFRLAGLIGYDFSRDYYFSELNRPYESHIKTNSSSSITGILKYVDDLVAFIYSGLDFSTSLVTSVFIISGLFIVNSNLTIVTLVFFGVIYAGLSYFVKGKLRKISLIVAQSKQSELKNLREGIGSIRDILIDRSQNLYLDDFKSIDLKMRLNYANGQFLTFFPRYLIEMIALAAIAIFVLYLSTFTNFDNSYLILLGPLAFGLQKLLPAFQKIYSSISNMITNSEGANITLMMCQKYSKYGEILNNLEPLKFEHQLKLQNVYYKYNEDGKYSLEDISLTIKKGQQIGITGQTGSGKSTLLDILMGLLKPVKGSIIIDNTKITNTNLLYSWQANISHVPQSIFLADTSIAQNIALGEDPSQIDYERISYAVKIAELEEVVKKNKYGIMTIVGERGVNLSGGQRQRIGIARAVYKKKKLLILDEATSALDNRTEKKIIENFKKLSPQITVIMVAHRLSSIKNCDRVIKINEGLIELDDKPSQVFGKI